MDSQDFYFVINDFSEWHDVTQEGVYIASTHCIHYNSVQSALLWMSHATESRWLCHVLSQIGSWPVDCHYSWCNVYMVTLVLAQELSPSSWMTWSTLSLLCCLVVAGGRRRAAENAKFSLTLREPIIRSSCTHGERDGAKRGDIIFLKTSCNHITLQQKAKWCHSIMQDSILD